MSKTTMSRNTKRSNRKPVHRIRTDEQIPGEMMKYAAVVPGLALAAVGILGLAFSLHLFAVGDTGDGALAAAVTALIGAAAAVWLAVEHRREVHRRH